MVLSRQSFWINPKKAHVAKSKLNKWDYIRQPPHDTGCNQ
jgi:hypothetical protein